MYVYSATMIQFRIITGFEKKKQVSHCFENPAVLPFEGQ